MLDYNSLPKISVIYKIINLQHPNRCYIGSAKNFRSRMQMHIYQLKNNKHHNYLMQRCFNKHGLDNFNVHIIDYCTEANIRDKEQFWIDTLEPFYNICKTVDQIETSPERLLEKRIKTSQTQKGVLKSNSTTEICNVSYKSRDKTYAVEIAINFNRYYLGSFKDINVATELADKYRFASEQDIIDYISNKKASKIKKSEYNYVSYRLYKETKNWFSYYKINRNEKVFFGYFKTELEAVRAYNNYITINKVNKPIQIIN